MLYPDYCQILRYVSNKKMYFVLVILCALYMLHIMIGWIIIFCFFILFLSFKPKYCKNTDVKFKYLPFSALHSFRHFGDLFEHRHHPFLSWPICNFLFPQDDVDAKVVVAGLSTTCSQKIHNQLVCRSLDLSDVHFMCVFIHICFNGHLMEQPMHVLLSYSISWTGDSW